MPSTGPSVSSSSLPESVFETAPFNHSRTSPRVFVMSYEREVKQRLLRATTSSTRPKWTGSVCSGQSGGLLDRPIEAGPARYSTPRLAMPSDHRPSVPCAAIVPAAVGFPLKIHSKATPINAPTTGPTT